MAVLVQAAASHRLDEIFQYTRHRWGPDQAESYIRGLFEAFDAIGTHKVTSKPIPSDFGVDGFYFRYRQHFVYWHRLPNDDIGIVTILHQRMHQMDRFAEDFELG